jgi:hypothetical protein
MRRRPRRRARPSSRAIVALAVAALIVIAAAVLIARGDRTPRPAHAATANPEHRWLSTRKTHSSS